MNFTKPYSILGLLLFLFFSEIASAQIKDSVINFIFTSDVHFGLTKDHFRNRENVPALDVNLAMVEAMNTLSKNQLTGEGIDALVITGDIANRMEMGIQSATTSWDQFKTTFLDNNHLKKANGSKSDLIVVPGNHDMSNAIGFHRLMAPKKDPASMIGIYNLMFPKKQITTFDSSLNIIHFSKDIKGVHFIFLSLYPDSAERVWMEKDLKNITKTTPVLLFAHSIPDVEPRFFQNPNGLHDINDEDKFENLVPENYKDGNDVKGETIIEQNGFANFINKHNNIKVYFHGHENWTDYYQYKGPNNKINLTCIRTDSPMKGRISLKDEKKLAFELVSINTNTGLLTIKEVLWNANQNSNEVKWGMMGKFNLK
ncbi:MAG: metallophosphoesterase [Bacteroidetes bacterium]|nr:metallophosphoesterase [Bacteroidota bacterium]